MSLFTVGMQGDELRNQLNSALPTSTLKGKKLAIIGDSISVSTWASTCANELQLGSVLNMAQASARHDDTDGGTTTNINMLTYGSVSADNTLSNQARALIRDSFTNGAAITWTHPITGNVTSYSSGLGTGLGNSKPDAILILLGQNGGQGALSDADFNTVIGQTYQALTRENQYSSIRWAVESLMINIPLANIFIASNYQGANLGYTTGKIRADASKRMANYMNCHYINTFEELGVNIPFEANLAPGRYLYDGIHPGNGVNSTYSGITLLGKYFANEMKKKYISR